MYPHAHFAAGLLAGILGAKLGFIQSIDILAVAVLAVLIDFDHYIMYFIRHKNLNPKKFWNTVAQRKEYDRTFIHHLSGMAAIIPAIFLVMWWNVRIGYILMAAYLSHMFLDYLSLVNKNLTDYHTFDVFGFKIPWSYGEEMMFVLMAIISLFLIM